MFSKSYPLAAGSNVIPLPAGTYLYYVRTGGVQVNVSFKPANADAVMFGQNTVAAQPTNQWFVDDGDALIITSPSVTTVTILYK